MIEKWEPAQGCRIEETNKKSDRSTMVFSSEFRDGFIHFESIETQYGKM
jgi:hypothetical protein